MKYKPPMMKERTCPAAEALVRELLLRKCPGVSSADNFAATHSYVMLWCLQTLDSSADAGAEELQQQAERKKGDAAIPGLQQAAVTQSLSANDRCHMPHSPDIPFQAHAQSVNSPCVPRRWHTKRR